MPENKKLFFEIKESIRKIDKANNFFKEIQTHHRLNSDEYTAIAERLIRNDTTLINSISTHCTNDSLNILLKEFSIYATIAKNGKSFSITNKRKTTEKATEIRPKTVSITLETNDGPYKKTKSDIQSANAMLLESVRALYNQGVTKEEILKTLDKALIVCQQTSNNKGVKERWFDSSECSTSIHAISGGLPSLGKR